MPRRTDIVSFLLAGSALLAACGGAEAQPAPMEAAARGCDIRTFAVAPSGAPDQSPYALYYDSDEAGIPEKIDCYGRRLEVMGYNRTLGLGSAGFDPRTDDPLLFAKIVDSCGLPPSTLARDESGSPIIFARGRDPGAIGCAARALGKSGRFGRIDIRSSDPPPAPALDSSFLGSQN